MTTRSELYKLIDELPDSALPVAEQRLAELNDPVLLSLLNAPEDDEPLTSEDLASIEEGRLARSRGETITLEEWRNRRRGASAE